MCAWKFSIRAFCFSVTKLSVVVTEFGWMSSERPPGAEPENVLNSASTSRCFGSCPFG